MLALEDHLNSIRLRGSVEAQLGGIRLLPSPDFMLANDPHLATRMPSIWYFAELKGVVSLVWCHTSLPGFAIGHNDHIAWGVTFGPDVQDLFLEKIDPQNPNRYLADGEWVDMNIVEEKIYVKGREEPILWAAEAPGTGL